VFAELPADLDTPLSAYLRLRPGPYAFLLESVEGGEKWARYSFLGSDPHVVLWAKDGRISVRRGGRIDRLPDGDPLEALRGLLRDFQPVPVPGLPRFQGGAVGYLAYDMVRHMERLPAAARDDLDLPDAVFMLSDTLLVFDNLRHRLLVIANAHIGKRDAAALDAAYDRAALKIGMTLAKLSRPARAPAPLPLTPPGPLLALGEEGFTSTMDEDAFGDAVRRAKEYIAAGDAFQIVLAQRFEAPFTLPPFSLYRALRRTNPSPYLYFLDFGDFAVAGSSPEILVKVSGDVVTIRPIAGTRHRGATPVEDKALAQELLADPKERAEHLMLLDLGRNDVGRVASIGTVKVTDQFFIERYSHVMHIVSNVEGKLAKNRDALDALAAGFPAGTVSGAPKVRAMQIIDELEKEKRGLYAGCVGYFSAAGEMDTCIILRTALIKDGTMYVQAGAGIVADSDPDFEQQECINKAKALFRAAEEARRFASAAKRGQ
jgi:anthranilate synthase component I